ncbi:MAG: phospholipase [Comamonas sp. SCN 67-35]|uniref:phospholipase A n=1 Tax=unclassified Comamonas TaxID=2638500 RepID=UPI00086DE0C8|nr:MULTISPECIES: phospholipase A [unclassified Comamonas]MBN9329776.1 phospholipase A [Comamonas sp.]ODU40205.1 MAG: phospholipase [Comamonas sp. SCN 67-35]OJW97219.1 MAG: phospholipase [Burkholderiales bacterium 66-26]
MHHALTSLFLACSAAAFASPGLAADTPQSPWQRCTAIAASAERLACFDQWALDQQADAAAAADRRSDARGDAPRTTAVTTSLPDLPAPPGDGCRNGPYTTLSRFWELEAGSDCGTLQFRGYRPLSVSVVTADTVNQQPTSDNPLNNAGGLTPYKRTEMRLQLSVRTKLARNLLTTGEGPARDSLWFGYTQQSYWQLFSPAISRPFRNTDHEPELVYIHPTTADLPWGWRWRYSGIGLVHQSNGQSLPLSRSWNRVYLMAGLERGNDWLVTARIWQRLHESAANDDNPHISDYIGRAEMTLGWNPSSDNTLALTLRHTLRAHARGSLRLEWLHRLGDRSNLRLHTAVFSGYGDSLIDYNRRRTVLSIGLSLLDF